jgi:hypothetical protein
LNIFPSPDWANRQTAVAGYCWSKKSIASRTSPPGAVFRLSRFPISDRYPNFHVFSVFFPKGDIFAFLCHRDYDLTYHIVNCSTGLSPLECAAGVYYRRALEPVFGIARVVGGANDKSFHIRQTTEAS